MVTRCSPATAFTLPLQSPGAARYDRRPKLLRQPARLAPRGGVATGPGEGAGERRPGPHRMRLRLLPTARSCPPCCCLELLRRPARRKAWRAAADAAHPRCRGSVVGTRPRPAARAAPLGASTCTGERYREIAHRGPVWTVVKMSDGSDTLSLVLLKKN
jgi:hypothetical protein